MTKVSAVILASFVLLVTAYSAQAEEYITDPSELPDQEAYKAVVKIKVYLAPDKDNLSWYASGSGIMIDQSGIILTNYHVVTLEDEFDEGEYDTGFRVCLPDSIDQAPDCNYVAKLIAKDKDHDLALLKLETVPGLSTKTSGFKYLNLAATDNTAVNDTAIVMGYPSIGGETITITKGIISGKEEKNGDKWLKTDALSSFGSSGGAAMDATGNIIGLVSQSNSDYLGSLGYLLNSASIVEWVNTYKNIAPQTNIYLEDLKEFAVTETNVNDSNVFSNEYFSLTKPSDWTFIHDNENEIFVYQESDDDGGYIQVEMIKYPYKISLDVVEPAIKDTLEKTAMLSIINVNKNENTTINGIAARKVVLSGAGETETFYYFANNNYLMEIDYYYGLNSQDESIIDGIMDSITLISNNQTLADPQTYSNQNPKFSFQTSDGWHIYDSISKSEPIKLYNPKFPEAYIYIEIAEGDENTRNYNNEEYLDYMEETLATVNTSATSVDASFPINESNPNHKLNDEITSVIYLDSAYKKLSTDTVLSRDIDYIVKSGDKRIFLTFRIFGDDENTFNTAWASAQKVINTFSLTSTPDGSAAIPEPKEEINIPTPGYTPPITVDSLANRLKGYILLQVESMGEAWYVKPESGQRIFMKNGEVAYNMMRELGLGITNTDLEKIPIGIESRFSEPDADGDGLGDKLEEGIKTDPNDSDSDDDGYTDGQEVLNNYNPLGAGSLTYNYSLVDRLRGKILLQVESKGEAWYINPQDGKRYYMKDGNSAYQIMRFLSLGITNANLEQIPEE